MDFPGKAANSFIFLCCSGDISMVNQLMLSVEHICKNVQNIKFSKEYLRRCVRDL